MVWDCSSEVGGGINVPPFLNPRGDCPQHHEIVGERKIPNYKWDVSGVMHHLNKESH